MIVLFHLQTCYAGQDSYEVFEFDDDTTDDDISDYGLQLAQENAELYGIDAEAMAEESGVESDDLYYETHEILEGSREEIEAEWGTICQA